MVTFEKDAIVIRMETDEPELDYHYWYKGLIQLLQSGVHDGFVETSGNYALSAVINLLPHLLPKYLPTETN